MRETAKSNNVAVFFERNRWTLTVHERLSGRKMSMVTTAHLTKSQDRTPERDPVEAQEKVNNDAPDLAG